MLRRSVLLGLLLGTAVPAAAQTTQTTDTDTSTIRIGPFGITPALLVRDIGRDENVFNERDNPKSDFTFTLVPRADVLVKPRGVRLHFTTATDYVYYRTYTSERSTNQSSSIRADFMLARFQPFLHASGVNSRARYNQEVDVRARHSDRTYGGGAQVRFGTNLNVGAAARSTQLRFDPDVTFRGESLSRSFDSTIRAFDVSTTLQLTPFTAMSVVATREEQRFTESRERDSDTLRVTPTFTFSPQAVLSGAISVGYRRFTPRSSVLPAFSGVVATVNAVTTLFSRHRVEVLFGRDLKYSYGQDTPYYLATGGTATVTSQIIGPMDVRVTGTRQLLAYRATRTGGALSPGNDTFVAYGGGVGYHLGGRFRAGMNAEWSRRDSELSADRTYRNRRIFGSLTWGAES